MTLSEREKKYLMAGSLVLAVLIPFYLFWLPALDRVETLEKTLAVQERAVGEMRALAAQYAAQKSVSGNWQAGMAQRPGNFSLFSHVDRLAEQAGVKSQIESMVPSVREAEEPGTRLAVVNLNLSRVFFNELVAFISGVEDRNSGVGIFSLSLSRAGDDTDEAVPLNAVLEIQALVPAEASP